VRGLAQERDRARRWARESEAARLDATDQVERLSLERARALLPTDPSRAHELAQAIPPSSRWRPLAELTMSVARTWGVSTVLWRGDDLSKLAGAADGSTIAWSAGQQVFVRRGDVETGFSLPAQVAALAVAPDGATLAVATVDGQVFHGPVGATPGLLDGKVDGKIRELSLDSAPGLLVAAGDDLAVWWELAVTPPRLVLPSTGPTPSPTATTAADLVVTRRYDRVDIWSRSQAQLVRSVGTYRNSWTRRAAQLMPDGIHLLVLDDQRTLWQDDIVTANRKRLGQITGNDTVVVWVGMIGPDPAVVDIQGRVHTWRDGQPWMDTYESNGKEERGSVLAVAAMGREVALGLESGEIVVVNTVDPRQQFVRVLRGHVGWVSEVLSWERSDARSLISAGGDGTLRSWALGVGEEQDRTATRPAPPIAGQGASTSSPQRVAGADPAVRSYEPTIGIPVGTAVSPDQRYFVWQRGQGGESLRLADLSSTEGGHAQLAGCNMYPVFAAASPYFACVRRFDGAVIVWDTRTWVPIDVAVTGVGQVDSLALSYDGQLVVAGIMADDGAVFALDRSTGTRGTWASPGNTWSVTFVPGTSWFATGGGGATVRLWRGASGGVAVLGGEASWIREVAAGKQRVYAADAAGTIGIWDVQRGRRARLRIDRGSTGEVDQLVVAPDEATLLARYDNRRLVVWDVESRASLPLPDDLIGGDLAADRRSFTATRPDGSTERIAMPERDLQHVPAQAPSAEDLEWRPFDLEWTPATPAKGVQHIVEVAAAKPDAADAQRAAGAALFRAGRLDEAASYFRRAIALGDSRAAWDLVTLETGSAAPGERERLLAAAAQRLAVRFPWDSWKVFGEHARGPLAYLVASPAASRAQKAAVLRTWMRAAQDDADRLDDLAYFALRAGTLDVARDIAVRLARTSDADHLATAAEVYHALGDDARAVALGERAMTLAPDREGLRTRMRRFRAADAEPSVRVHWMVPPVIGPPVAPRLVPPDEAQP
jgi:WD40 repeat protein